MQVTATWDASCQAGAMICKFWGGETVTGQAPSAISGGGCCGFLSTPGYQDEHCGGKERVIQATETGASLSFFQLRVRERSRGGRRGGSTLTMLFGGRMISAGTTLSSGFDVRLKLYILQEPWE